MNLASAAVVLVLAAPAAAGTPAEVAFSLQPLGGGVNRIEGTFDVDVPSSVAWEVLTDYDHIGSFVPSLLSSAIIERHSGESLIDQETVGRFWFLSRSVSVRLRTEEKPYRRLAFEDVSHRDFEIYKGFWSLERRSEGLRVVYHLEAKTGFWAAAFMARAAMRKMAKDLLLEVRAEMLRRARPGSSLQAVP